MPTFPKGFTNYQLHVANAKILASLAATPDTPAPPTGKKFYSTAGDERTLRGIPAIGQGCPGRINGTNPETVCNREAA